MSIKPLFTLGISQGPKIVQMIYFLDFMIPNISQSLQLNNK